MEEFLSVIARFDKATEQNLIGLAADAGVEGLDPHLTFGVYSEMLAQDLIEWVKRIAGGQPKLPIGLCGIGVYFGDWLSVVPRADIRLLGLHQRLHGRYEEYCTNFTAPGDWTPHISLCGCTPERLREFAALFRETKGELISLQVSGRRGDAFQLLGSFDLIGSHSAEKIPPKKKSLTALKKSGRV